GCRGRKTARSRANAYPSCLTPVPSNLSPVPSLFGGGGRFPLSRVPSSGVVPLSRRESGQGRGSEHPELRTARPGICRDFVGGREYWFAGADLAERLATTGAHRLGGRADAGTGPLAKGIFHHPVLTRVIGDDREDPTRLQRVHQVGKRGFQLGGF